MWPNVPSRVRKILTEGVRGQIEGTPKVGDAAFRRVSRVVIGNNRTASLASLNYLKSKGLNTLLRSASLDREAKCAGFILVSVAREIAVYDNPVRKPSGIVAGGEITVAVKGEGVGGRNQELALFAATKISGIKGCVVASLSTDGVEGSTDAAGPSLIAILYSRRKNWSLLLRSF